MVLKQALLRLLPGPALMWARRTRHRLRTMRGTARNVWTIIRTSQAPSSQRVAVHPLQYYTNQNYGNLHFTEASASPPLPPGIAQEIMDFFAVVPPFYFPDTADPLKVGGLWEGYLRTYRPLSLEAIANKDTRAYEALLQRCFRNEIVLGIHSFWINETVQPQRVPDSFVEWMDGFTYMTGRPIGDLASHAFGAPIGYQTSEGLVNLEAPRHGLSAQQIVHLLNARRKNREHVTLVELGSGFGGTVEKVLRWFDGPIRAILLDIPLTLTTAYAYLVTTFGPEAVTLVSTREELARALAPSDERLRCICVPTLFADALQGMDVDVLFNEASLAEMSPGSVKFYLDTLITARTAFFLEISSNFPRQVGDWVELRGVEFPVPASHVLLSRMPHYTTARGWRFIASLYGWREI